MTTGRTLRVGEALFGGGLVAMGGLIAVDTLLSPSVNRGAVGPALFPYVISGCLALVGLSLLREAMAGKAPHAQGLELDGGAVALVSAGLVIQFLTLEFLGWIPAATVLFMAVSRAFGERRHGLNLAIGLVMTAGCLVVFNYGLGLNLPVGSIADWFAPAD